MEKDICAICEKPVAEDAPILTMGGFGNPRYLCPDCEKDLDTVTAGTDAAEIRRAMAALSERISKSNTDDTLTVKTLDVMLKSGDERARAIEEGRNPDEGEDGDAPEETFDEIPEELEETEEDRALDEKEIAQGKKFDKILNIAWAVIGVLAVALVVWRIFFK